MRRPMRDERDRRDGRDEKMCRFYVFRIFIFITNNFVVVVALCCVICEM